MAGHPPVSYVKVVVHSGGAYRWKRHSLPLTQHRASREAPAPWALEPDDMGWNRFAIPSHV
jgi:hypothetical protein